MGTGNILKLYEKFFQNYLITNQLFFLIMTFILNFIFSILLKSTLTIINKSQFFKLMKPMLRRRKIKGENSVCQKTNLRLQVPNNHKLESCDL